MRPDRVALEYHPDIAVFGVKKNAARRRRDHIAANSDFASVKPLQPGNAP